MDRVMAGHHKWSDLRAKTFTPERLKRIDEWVRAEMKKIAAAEKKAKTKKARGLKK